MARTLAATAALALLAPGCGDDAGSGSGSCASLSREACEADETCLALMAWDVTSEHGGSACWRGPGGDWGDPVYLRCVLRPGMTGGVITFAYDASADRCYAFEAGTLVPSGWPDCADRLPECTCRSDSDCPDGESCVFYGEREQTCRPPMDGPVACAFEPFPVTGERCTDDDRAADLACRPFFCDSGCAPTCRCTESLEWSCAAELCVDSPTGACGDAPRCAGSCL